MSTLQVSGKKLIVLDLNGLLLFRVFKDKAGDLTQEQRQRAETVGNFWVWYRPHLKSFLTFLFDNFDVACWSSAMSHNVKPLAQNVFGDYNVEFLWDQTKCDKERHPDRQEKKPLFKKVLRKIWQQYPTKYSQENTLLVDDSPLKAKDNPPNLLYSPPEWSLDATDDVDKALGEDGHIRHFLQGLADSDLSVAEYVESHRQ